MIKKILGIVAILSLGACASPYVATPYDRAAHNVHSIAMMDDALPEKAIAYEVASVGSNFGLIGALVDAGIQASRQDAVNDALVSINFDAEERLERRMAAALSTQGYNIAPPDGRGARKTGPVGNLSGRFRRGRLPRCFGEPLRLHLFGR